MGVTFNHDLGPGLHVLRESEPMKRAGAMAASMRAELCATLEQADELLARRSDLPNVDIHTITTLQVLARRVARAHRIADRTRDRAAREIAGTLAGGAGVAIHPDTIRARAASLEQARTVLAEAEERVRELEATETESPLSTESQVDHAAPAQVPDEIEVTRSPVSLAQRRRTALGSLAGSFGIAFLLLGLASAPLWAALLVPLATSLWASRYLRPDGASDDHARSAASSLLAAVSASTDELFGAMRASQEKGTRGALLDAQRSRAEEDVRVAARAWHELAGPDVDTDALDEVVKRYDPQHEDARLVALETVGVRAVDQVLRQFEERWRESWQELGLPAPDPSVGEAAVDDLARQAARPIVLVGAATSRGPELARVAPAAAVVVLDGPLEAGPSADRQVDDGAVS